MSKRLSAAEMKYIIYRVMKNGYESIEELREDPCEFNRGRRLAYYEVLNTIYNRLGICEQDPKEFGYSENWEREFLSK